MKKDNYREIGYGLASLFWPKHSHLLIRGDSATWSLMWDAIELDRICQKLGIKSIRTRKNLSLRNQSVFYIDRRKILKDWKRKNHRVAFPYYHGNPSKDAESREMLTTIANHHREIDRIQVTNRQMKGYILDTGIDPKKVFLIPIGVNCSLLQNSDITKNRIRNELGIPLSAIVVGSFQKDGNGWENGLTPKLIKGPDTLIETLKILRHDVKELFVLLTGPARGYVKKGLEEAEIPYKHVLLDDYARIGDYYHALDLYIISSRDEGGPKAVLESMASGIPLVSTRVGQATDLIIEGENGFLAEIDRPDELAHHASTILHDSDLAKRLIKSGYMTAEINDYDNQVPLWKSFFNDFVNW